MAAVADSDRMTPPHGFATHWSMGVVVYLPANWREGGDFRAKCLTDMGLLPANLPANSPPIGGELAVGAQLDVAHLEHQRRLGYLQLHVVDAVLRGDKLLVEPEPAEHAARQQAAGQGSAIAAGAEGLIVGGLRPRFVVLPARQVR